MQFVNRTLVGSLVLFALLGASGGPVTAVARLAMERGERTVQAIAFTPDHRLLIAGDADGRVEVWQTAGWHRMAIWRMDAPVATLAVAPNSRLLAIGGPAGSGRNHVRLCDPADGRIIHAMEASPGSVTALAFSPDGRLLAAGMDEGRAELWETGTGEEVHAWQFRGAALGLGFSADGATLFCGTSRATIQRWQTAAGEALPALRERTGAASAFAFSMDGSAAFSASYATGNQTGPPLERWNLVDGTRRLLSGMPEWIVLLAVRPDGQVVAAGDDDGSLTLYLARGGEPIGSLEDRVQDVRAVAFSPDGKLLACGGAAGHVKVWNLATGRVVRTLR